MPYPCSATITSINWLNKAQGIGIACVSVAMVADPTRGDETIGVTSSPLPVDHFYLFGHSGCHLLGPVKWSLSDTIDEEDLKAMLMARALGGMRG
jgi:hypothetical protein